MWFEKCLFQARQLSLDRVTSSSTGVAGSGVPPPRPDATRLAYSNILQQCVRRIVLNKVACVVTQQRLQQINGYAPTSTLQLQEGCPAWQGALGSKLFRPSSTCCIHMLLQNHEAARARQWATAPRCSACCAAACMPSSLRHELPDALGDACRGEARSLAVKLQRGDDVAAAGSAALRVPGYLRQNLCQPKRPPQSHALTSACAAQVPAKPCCSTAR
jgi:hypothetical protein